MRFARPVGLGVCWLGLLVLIAPVWADVTIRINNVDATEEGLNDPKIRAHILNLAQEWAAPHLENEELAEKVEEFEFDIENERRDVEGKRRIKIDV